jgi:hypothetical protein
LHFVKVEPYQLHPSNGDVSHCRSIGDTKMMNFFRNDFTEERWRRAALKNAYSLLGKQRFLHAAAFFLLADSLTDAVDVSFHGNFSPVS